MSIYSGKCDFADYLIGNIETNEEVEQKLKKMYVYIGNNMIPLKMATYKDAIPYFPRIVFFGSNNVLRLTEQSYVDIEENQSLEYYHKFFLREYRKCKRKKEEYNPEDVAQKASTFKVDLGVLELAKRVGELGEKSTFKGIYLESKNILYREPMIGEMIASGYSEEEARRWVYSK